MIGINQISSNINFVKKEDSPLIKSIIESFESSHPLNPDLNNSNEFMIKLHMRMNMYNNYVDNNDDSLDKE